MIKCEKIETLEKTGPQKKFEAILLFVVLAVAAIRCSYTESLQSTMSLYPKFSNITSSLTLSLILLCSIGIWLLVMLAKKEFVYRKTGLEIPIFLFFIAAIISTFFAANKRDAIDYSTTLLVIMLSILFTAQLISSTSQIRLILIVIVALGCMNTVESISQAKDGNQNLIRDYQSNPAQHLNQLNIKDGSIEHWQYVHRLYSRDIKGFFSTSNSLGSLLVLSIFAVLAIIRQYDIQQKKTFVPLVALILLSVGFALARSHGAILAITISLLLLAVRLKLSSFILRHKRLILLVIIGATLLVVASIIGYGINHSKLPGGNSMLVRWQYWVASVDIIKDYPLGTGGGNFANAYLKHKIPAALETVADPHNWILSITSQYSLLGLLGFSLILLSPIYNIFFDKFGSCQKETLLSADTKKHPKTGIALGITIIAARMLLVEIPQTNALAVNAYIFASLCVFPAAAFMIAFYILDKFIINFKTETTTTIILSFAIVAIAIHNLVDYAIFESGIFSIVTIMLSCLCVLTAKRETYKINLSRKLAILATAVCFIVIAAFYLTTIRMVSKSGELLAKAFASTNDSDTKENLNLAITADKCNPKISLVAANMYHNRYDLTHNIKDLTTAQHYYNIAISKDASNYRVLSDFSKALLEKYKTDKNKDELNTALNLAKEAIKNYPSKSQLWMTLGDIYIAAKKNQDAQKCYKKALKLEDDFQALFREMYPEENIILYRMGRDNYDRLRKITALQD